MSKVVELRVSKPHRIVPDIKGIKHKIPASVFHRIAAGDMPIEQLEEYELIIPVIVSEWIQCIGCRCDREE